MALVSDTPTVAKTANPKLEEVASKRGNANLSQDEIDAVIAAAKK